MPVPSPGHPRGAAQVKPPPKVTSSTRLPARMRPVRRASSIASGIEADDVFP
jgi:hypothetical protein